MKKDDFNKRLNALFKKTGVKKLDTDSKDVFSYAQRIDYVRAYKSKIVLVTILFTASLTLQIFSLALNIIVPEPRHFMTTINGHVYEISKPRESMAEAVAVNNMIEGRKKIITSNAKND